MYCLLSGARTNVVMPLLTVVGQSANESRSRGFVVVVWCFLSQSLPLGGGKTKNPLIACALDKHDSLCVRLLLSSTERFIC